MDELRAGLLDAIDAYRSAGLAAEQAAQAAVSEFGDPRLACPRCGTRTARVHGYYERTTADVPIYDRVLVRIRVRRMRCPSWTVRSRPSASRSPAS